MSTYYPIFVNVSGKKCVVVGGGEVAERKVRSLVEHGASVTVISSHVCEGLLNMAEKGDIKILQREYQYGDLKDSLIAVAATDDFDVNLRVANEGRKTGVMTNVVDDPENSDYIVPSLLRRGNLSIAISTGGQSPALSRKIRSQLEDIFPPEYSSLVLLISEVRQELKQKDIHIDADAWQKSLSLEPLLDMLRKNEYSEARDKLRAELLALRSSSTP